MTRSINSIVWRSSCLLSLSDPFAGRTDSYLWIMKNQQNPLLSLSIPTLPSRKKILCGCIPGILGAWQIFTMSWVAEYLVWVQQTILWWRLFIFSKVTTAHRQQNICITDNENLVRLMKLLSENASVKWKILKLKNACNYPLLSVAWLVTHEAGRSNCYFPRSPGFPERDETVVHAWDESWVCVMWLGILSL